MFDFDVVTGPAGLTAPQQDHQAAQSETAPREETPSAKSSQAAIAAAAKRAEARA